MSDSLEDEPLSDDEVVALAHVMHHSMVCASGLFLLRPRGKGRNVHDLDGDSKATLAHTLLQTLPQLLQRFAGSWTVLRPLLSMPPVCDFTEGLSPEDEKHARSTFM